MNIISLYSGADNLGDGTIQAGHNVTLAIEMNPDACKTIKLNHPDTEVICDEVGPNLSVLPKSDCVIGGPPCPEFSRANSDRTFDMCEVNNFWKAVEITKSKYYFMENVQDINKKLIKSNHLINAANYGVPQTRVRRFYTNIPKPSQTHAKNPQQTLFGTQLKKWVSVSEALNVDDNLFISVDGFPKCNQKEKTKSVQNTSQTVLTSRNISLTNYKIYSLKYLQEKNPRMTAKHKPNYLDKPAYTVTTKDRGVTTDGMISDYKYCRKLTNSELAILQGFRKDFLFYGKKTSVRKQIGNALPAQISKAFFEQI